MASRGSALLPCRRPPCLRFVSAGVPLLAAVGRVDVLVVVGRGGQGTHLLAELLGGEQGPRRRVLSDELIPVMRGEYRLGDEYAEVCPSSAHRGIEDGTDRRGVAGDGRTQSDRRLRSDLVHETPPSPDRRPIPTPAR